MNNLSIARQDYTHFLACLFGLIASCCFGCSNSASLHGTTILSSDAVTFLDDHGEHADFAWDAFEWENVASIVIDGEAYETPAFRERLLQKKLKSIFVN